MPEPKPGDVYQVVEREPRPGEVIWEPTFIEACKWTGTMGNWRAKALVLEPIDPARVTIAPKPERFYRNDDARVRDRENPDWHVVLRFLDQADQLICTLNTLERAAKEKSNG